MPAIQRSLVGCLLVGAAILGTEGQSNGQRDGRGSAPTEVRGVLKAIDAGKNTITLSMTQRRGEPPVENKTFTLTEDVEVAYGTTGRGRAVYREGKLAELPAGAVLTLTLSADQKSVESILAEAPF